MKLISNFFMPSTWIITLLLLFTHSSHASDWKEVKFDGIKKMAINKSSIRSFPGLVVFDIRFSLDPPSDNFFSRFAYLCSSKEVWGISSTVSKDVEITDFELLPDSASKGIQKAFMTPSIVSFVSGNCGKNYSKEPLEIPIARTDNTVIMLIAKETVISVDKRSTWEKFYKYSNEPVLVNGQPQILNGKPLTTTKVQRDLDFGVINTEYNCRNKTSVVMVASQYLNDKSAPQTFRAENPQPSRVLPGSSGQAALEFVCNL